MEKLLSRHKLHSTQLSTASDVQCQACSVRENFIIFLKFHQIPMTEVCKFDTNVVVVIIMQRTSIPRKQPVYNSYVHNSVQTLCQ